MKRYIKSTESFPDNMFAADGRERAVMAQLTDSEDLLRIYTYDPDYRVQREVAMNPNTPVDCLEYLSENSGFITRGLVAWHPSTPRDVLERLAQDPEATVANVAKRRLEGTLSV